ncbi:hypothetical protein NDU88_002861 [Pleurodeles waltl]|uniref:Uncharacterized protein n=1 Tax=Pleurodeles waltl TaxID=8319 RepID=A0AAV7TPB4_PLEWA|nr:hypothetical protein NDU88_002861 [Pleurodeles waltl]
MAASRQPDTLGAPPGRSRKAHASESRYLYFRTPKSRTSAAAEEKERENAVTGERRAERLHDERRRPEQLTPGGNPDDGQGGPETQGLRHIPGGA